MYKLMKTTVFLRWPYKMVNITRRLTQLLPFGSMYILTNPHINLFLKGVRGDQLKVLLCRVLRLPLSLSS